MSDKKLPGREDGKCASGGSRTFDSNGKLVKEENSAFQEKEKGKKAAKPKPTEDKNQEDN